MAIVTISREYGSGGSIIGKALAYAQQYDYLDKSVIAEKMNQEGTIWGKREEQMGETRPSLWERFDRSFIAMVAMEEQLIYESALSGKVVIVGRAGNRLLRDIPFALHVRIIAPLNLRISRVIERGEISRDEASRLNEKWVDGVLVATGEEVTRDTAREYIERADFDRSRYVRAVYHENWANPTYFDRVFDTGKMDYETVVHTILNMAIAKDRLMADASLLVLRQRAAAARVKAALLKSPDLFIPTIDVYHDGQAIIMTGIVKHPSERIAAEAVAQHAAQDEPLISKLHYRL